MPRSKIKIISGGQTGADRASLDFAIENGFEHGGWCPKGRLAEDGPLADCYKLKETPSKDYRVRIEWNARDSDGTVVFTVGPKLSGGSLRTFLLPKKHGKPLLHRSRDGGPVAPEKELRRFIQGARDRLA
jgi:hypothetical protein